MLLVALLVAVALAAPGPKPQFVYGGYPYAYTYGAYPYSYGYVGYV